MKTFYRLLLHLYPTSFRREYGGELQAVFAARAARTSSIGAFALVFGAIADVLGNATLVHLDILKQDLRYTLRTLRRSPGFALTAIAIIALGIGANTAAFTVADYVMLRPLPFPGSEQIVSAQERVPGYTRLELPPPNYRDWRDRQRSFALVGAYHERAVTFSGAGEPRLLSGTAVADSTMQVLGIAPLVGHLFSGDELRDGANVVLLSYATWRDSFGRDASVVGKSVDLDGVPYTVSGVMPPAFAFPDPGIALWMPMRRGDLSDDDRTNNWFRMIARLRNGVTVAQAQADLDRIATQLRSEHPVDNADIAANVYPLRDNWSAQNRPLLIGLCGAAAALLLITCANLASLLLGRALSRERELAVRTALGAGRERVLRQLLVETLTLVVVGSVLGMLLATVAVPLFSRLAPSAMPLSEIPKVDVRMLLIATVVAAVTAVAFGIFPVILRRGGTQLDALRQGQRAGGGQRARVRAALVASELAMVVAMLCCGGLLLRAMWRVQAVDLGFRTEQVFTARTTLLKSDYQLASRRLEFYQHVLGGLRALPSVTSAGYTSFLPMTMGGGIFPVKLNGEVPRQGEQRNASIRFITPGYLPTLRIPVVRGRDVSESDLMSTPMVAVVSQSFADKYWPGADPVGRQFNFAFHDRTVVGVAKEVKVRGPERESEPQVYIPYRQAGDSELTFFSPKDLVIRSSLPASTVLAAVRRLVHEADPQQPVALPRDLSVIVDNQLASRATQLRVLTALGALAILLAGVGVFGVLSFTVAQRRQELAVRIALGARSHTIRRMVFRQGALIALAGMLPGLGIAVLAGRTLSAALAGLDPFDPLSFGVVAVAVSLMVLFGTWLPAARAASIDPVGVLRGE